MRNRASILFLLTSLIWLLIPSCLVTAAPGTPNSLAFGYGANISINGPHGATALRLAAGMRLDWVGLDFDWEETQPTPTTWRTNTQFHNAMLLARSLELSIMVSMSHAPVWAITSQGSDSHATASAVRELAARYPNLLVLELFPGANTCLGWGPPQTQAKA